MLARYGALYVTIPGGICFWLKFKQSSENGICMAGERNTDENISNIYWQLFQANCFLPELLKVAWSLTDSGNSLIRSDKMYDAFEL